MIKLVDVSKYYHDESGVVIGLRNVNLEFKLGEFVAITGESGSGKSTLLNVIAGVDTYENGEMYVDGEETSYYDAKDWETHRKEKIGFIFQSYNLLESYTVIENVEAVLILEGVRKKERKERAKEILEKVGLGKHLKHKATKLSGGQQQRLAIARALAKDTKIIVADEPTGNLDSVNGKEIILLLSEISKEKLVIVVTHNYEEISQYATRKIRIYDSEVVEDREIKNFTEVENIKEPSKSSKLSFIAKSSIFALLNFKNQPRKSIFLLLFTFIISTFVLIFLMTSIVTNFTPDGRQNLIFNEIYETRVIASKKDKTSFTQDEINVIAKNKKINSIVEYSNILETYWSFEYLSARINLIDVVPSKSITLGRMPRNENEVVIYSSYMQNDLFIERYLNKNMDFGDKTYKIVGKTNFAIGKFSDYVYVHKSNLKDFAIASIFTNNFYYKIGYYEEETFIYNYFNSYISNIKVLDTLPENTVSFYYPYETRPNSLVIFNDITFKYVKTNSNDVIYLSSDVYDKLIETIEVKHITINLNNSKDYNSIKNTLLNLGIYSTSPYHNSSNYAYIIDQVAIFGFVIILTIGLSFIYLTGYLVIRAVMLSKKKDYTILRSIGADSKTIMNINKFEIILLFIFGFLLSAIMIIILKLTIKNPYVQEVLDTIKFKYFLYTVLADILLALLVSRRYNKLLMKKSLLANMKVN